MSAFTKLALFALVLVGSFAAGAAIGAALPELGPSQPIQEQHSIQP